MFLALVIVGYLYYRRREAAKERAAREAANIDVKPDIPARADAVLSRPDPHFAARASSLNSAEKGHNGTGPNELGTVRLYGQSDSTINLDPAQPLQSSGSSARSNPFTDKLSIQTASERSQSTNVIPIAFVAPSGPTRPQRDPNVSLNDRGHQDEDLLGEEIHLPYASSTRSGFSGKSYMTASSIATDLDEPPQIMSPTQGVVRQVLNVAPAQVLRVPSNGSSAKPRGARAAVLARHASKGTIGRSPLAQQSYTSADIPLTNRSTSPTSSRADPFTDAASPNNRESFADSARSTDTFGTPTYNSEGPFTPRPGATFAERPVSVASTADGFSIRADIGTASRVILGMQSAPATAVSPGFSHHASGGFTSPGFQSRATSMQTNSGRTMVSMEGEDDLESRRPYSVAMSSKTTDSRADSVLSRFPFVPPSPISALPPRSPGANSTPALSPASTGSTFAKQQAMATPLPNSPPLSPRSTTTTQGSMSPRTISDRQPAQGSHPLATGRTISTFSTASSGLETYPFQFGDEESTPIPPLPRNANRASLDTFKITRDLAAFSVDLDGYPDSGNVRR